MSQNSLNNLENFACSSTPSGSFSKFTTPALLKSSSISL